MNLGKKHRIARGREVVATVSGKLVTKNIDIAVYVVSFMGQFIALDQVRLVWVEHLVAGVSLSTWVFFTFASSVWCVYGYFHKNNLLILTNIIWLCINAAVAVGVVVYGV